MTGYPPWRVVSVDNGTTHLGIAISDYDVLSERFYVKELRTLSPKEMAYHTHPLILERKGKTAARTAWIREMFKVFLLEAVPDVVAIETPFIGSVATLSSYAPLRLSLEGLIDVVYEVMDELQIQIHIEKVSPHEAKKAVLHGDAFSDKKEKVRENIESHPNICLREVDLNTASLDEIDAIAIGYHVTHLLSRF